MAIIVMKMYMVGRQNCWNRLLGRLSKSIVNNTDIDNTIIYIYIYIYVDQYLTSSKYDKIHIQMKTENICS